MALSKRFPPVADLSSTQAWGPRAQEPCGQGKPLFGFPSRGHFLIEMNDGQLLRRYVQDGDDSAFRELADRHLGLVHATATRRVGDPHAAADVSQAVFCLLVRKARSLLEVAELGGWLHRATCWKASEHERAERRRRAREQVSAISNPAMNPAMNSAASDEVWKELAPILDVCLDRLEDADREIICSRRFYRAPLAA
jgi:DNA-directed RNA polymerase specialized sigma24 family protein